MNIERKQYTISEETGKFIDCLFMADALYNKIYSAVEDVYGSELACKACSEYSNIHNSIRNLINHYLVESINENIAEGSKTKI